MRYLLAALAILVSASNAFGGHIQKDAVHPLFFGCESAENMISLVEAKSDAEADAILAGGLCYEFNGVPARAVKYVGTYHDPMAKKDFEVYEVEIIMGQRFFTYTAVGGEDT